MREGIAAGLTRDVAEYEFKLGTLRMTLWSEEGASAALQVM
jgi:hypothetical protein